MTISQAERRIRAGLPMIRFLQAYLPYAWSGWLNRQSLKTVQLSAGVTHSTASVDGVPCVWIIPQDRSADPVLLYLHGGGFVFGLTSLHLQMVASLANKMGMRSLMVDYRLAPAHPFPAALDDCLTAYRWLLKQGIQPGNIVLAGDSAGGNLAITSLMKLRDDGHPLPAAAACLSPVGDLTDRKPGGFKDPLLPTKAVRYYNQSYVGNGDPHNPLISPVFGDWHGLPPLLIHVGEEEILCDDATRMVSLASSAGVQARLEIFPRMWHVWQLFQSLPQAIQSLDDIAGFLAAQLENAGKQPLPG
jgi:monoterpene epsilon-lactone hydrolase